MKLLRNPIVTAILALVAVVIVFVQFGGMKLFAGKPKPAPTVQQAATVPAPTAQKAAAPAPQATVRPAQTAAVKTAAAASSTVFAPERDIDAKAVERDFKYWVQAPLRDPFLLMQPVVKTTIASTITATNSPVRTWKLKAIWNQTDTRLAVINNRVYRVGDVVVEGYKLIRIERDEVWFQGPTENERLGFVEPGKPATASGNQNTSFTRLTTREA